METLDGKKAFIDIDYDKNSKILIKTNILDIETNYQKVFIFKNFDESNIEKYIRYINGQKIYNNDIDGNTKFFTVRIIKNNMTYERTFKNLKYVVLDVLSIIPANESLENVITTTITVTFNKDVLDTTVDLNSFYISLGVDKVACTLTKLSNSQYRLTPNSSLTNYTQYSIHVLETILSIDGIVETNLPRTYTFTTVGVNLDVSSILPTNGSINNTIDSHVRVTFNKDVLDTTVTTSSFYIEGIAGTISKISNSIYEFVPDVDLEHETLYTVRLTNAIQALDGYPGTLLPRNYTFTTISEIVTQALDVSDIDPNNLAVDIALDKIITATFNKSVIEADMTDTNFYLWKFGAITIQKSLDTIVMSEDGDGSQLFYTFNAGSEPTDPTDTSTEYTAPIPFVEGYYKCIAKYNGKLSSVQSSHITNVLDLQTAIGSTVSVITGGNAKWFPQVAYSHDGAHSAQSGDITAGQSTWLEMTYPSNAMDRTLSFWWKVSSESGCDCLTSYLNDIQQSQISGEIDWIPGSVILPSGQENRVVFTYSKDGSADSGLDSAWIDELSLTYNIAQPTITKVNSTIVMDSTDPTKQIYYTYSTSGTPADPTDTDTEYTAPMPLAYGNYKAISKVSGNFSTIATQSFTVAPAVISRNGSNIEMSADASTQIFYTYSASGTPADPTDTDTEYTAPIPVAYGNYKAIVKHLGAFSTITTQSFAVTNPSIAKVDSTVVMSADSGAQIFYTYNATVQPADPTDSDTEYTTPIAYAAGYYKAIAKHNGSFSSITLKTLGMSSALTELLFDNDVVDLAGTYNYTNTGCTFATGRKGDANGSLLVSGTNHVFSDIISISPANKTVRMWVRFSTTEDTYFFYGSPSPNHTQLSFIRYTNLRSNMGVFSSWIDGGNPTLNTWYHVLQTNNGTTQYFYVNGTLIGSRAYVAPANQTRISFGGLTSFEGQIDDFAIFDSYYDQAAVTADYNL